ncbi:MAG: FHA domain-containing protein [Deltaproteobacteria bacterium]|nr:MAG: FHA domain-containing protein [Deltaproteobacteria bacterium]
MPQLVLKAGLAEEEIFPLKEGENTIGRAENNDIVLMNKSLSRRHAKLEVLPEKIILTDLNSKNGTFVNNVRVLQCDLKHGDLIKCGDVLFTLIDEEGEGSGEDPPEAEPKIVKELTTEFTHLSIQDLLDIEVGQENTLISALRVKHQDARQRTQDKLHILLKVSEILSSPEHIDTLLEKIVELLFKIMDVDRAAILMIDEETGEIEPKIVKSSAGIPETQKFYSAHIVRYVIEKGVAVLSADAKVDPRFDEAKSIIYQSIRSSMCVPLRPRDRTIGVLYVDNLFIPDRYADEDLEFLSAFANQAAIAIENSKLYKKIEEAAIMRNNFLRFFPPATIKRIEQSQKIDLGAIETEVTALFSDISSFTEMSSLMEPREVVDMLNEYFPVMSEIVFKHGGTLEKYIGDALMAVWGAPFRHEDDVDHAVRAAIEMQQAMRSLNEAWKGRFPQIAIHIGLNTGKVAAGNIGSEKYIQYATIGDATNVAARICNVAQAGEIVLSERTYSCLEESYPFEKLPPAHVKGKKEPLTLYRLQWELL